MQKKILLIILILGLSGCAIKHDYKWREYFIAPDRLTSQIKNKNAQPLKIIKNKSSNSKKLLGNVGAHQYFSNDQEFTNGIADQLTTELRKKRIKIMDTAEKSLAIRVDSAHFERGMWKIATNLDFTITLGGKKIKSLTVRNSSPGAVDRAYDGAIALAVIEIINDPEIAAYINK